MIFGPNRSRRRELKFEKFSNEQASKQTNEANRQVEQFEIFRKMFDVFFKKKIAKIFEHFFDFVLFVSFVSFVCSLARSFENFSNFSSRRRDRFGPKIVQFRAILAIFRPFAKFHYRRNNGPPPAFATFCHSFLLVILKGKGIMLKRHVASAEAHLKLYRNAPSLHYFRAVGVLFRHRIIIVSAVSAALV